MPTIPKPATKMLSLFSGARGLERERVARPGVELDEVAT